MAVGDSHKIEVHYRHSRHWLWYITVVSFVTGSLLAACLRTQSIWEDNVGIRTWRPEVIASHLKAAKDEIDRQREEVKTLRDKVDHYEQILSRGDAAQGALKSELDQYKVLTGLTPMEGPGVTLTLKDSTLRSATNNPEEIESLILHDYDLQRVVNELRAAGAEAIDINGQRLVERTAIRCVGPVTQVNNYPTNPPYVITAIGDPQALFGALNISGGILDWLKQLGFPVTVEKKDHVRVPAYNGPVELRRAHPVLTNGSSSGSSKEGKQ